MVSIGYEGRIAKAFAFSRDSNYDQLLDKVYNVTGIDRDHYRMRSRLTDLLKTPQGDWYEGKLTRHVYFDAIAHIDGALNRVPTKFVDEDRCRFMASCFGHFLTMHREIKFSGGVIHQLLLRELYHNGPTDEM
ncbi:hypothetical protein Ddye_012218 [Dipteronia dyeriana]|uniref:Uncharacterized protein n=1 Tax=Dipteronia dyeriana TaxID=168575 RepID=A0AAE0CID9_9ROSI|nr:hypothetical protein Ddye_012218 [Dipteronia dyeriana]